MNFQVFLAKNIITWCKYGILDNLVPYLADIGRVPCRYMITRRTDVVLCQNQKLFICRRDKKTGMKQRTHTKKKQSIGELLATGRLRKTSRSSSQAATLDLQEFVDIRDISLK